MPTLTPKENYMRLLRGETPEYVPIYTMIGPGWNGQTATAMCGPNIWGVDFRSPQGGRDPWGVNYVANEETGFAALPEPNNFILNDITKWHEVIKPPGIPENIDWEAMAKKDLEKFNVDRTRTATMLPCEFSPFQQLMAFMGFNEGLCAMYEEPETVKELYNFITDFYMPIIEKSVEYYKPDIFYILDDSATKLNPFVSVEMYRDLLKPIYLRLSEPARDRGIPVQFHNCGRCEPYIDDMLDFGVKIMDPSQQGNDLLAVKEKYKGKLAIAGSWEWKVPSTWPEVDEEQVRQSVRDVIDRYAPGGGYAFGGGVLGRFGDETVKKVNGWVQEEAYNYCMNFYK